jgi:hypothetical protein
MWTFKQKGTNAPGLLRIRAVGPGYLVLRNPEQYACLFRVEGGLNPWMEDPEILGEKVRKLDLVLADLRNGEQIQFLTKRVLADVEEVIGRYDARIHENAPEIFRHQYPEFLRFWLRRFYREQKICNYRSYVLFTAQQPQTTKNKKERNISIDEILRRGKSWISQLNMVGIEAVEATENEIYSLLFEEFSLQRFQGNAERFKKASGFSGGSLGLQTLREMLVTYPWDFNDPTFFKVGDAFGKTLYVTEFPSFNEQNLFFQELYEQSENFKISLFTKGVDLFRAQSIVEKQIQSDQGALWKRQNVVNFEAKAALEYRQSVLSLVSERKTSLAKFSLYVTLFSDSQQRLISNFESLSRMFKNVHPLSGYAEQKQLFLSNLPQATDTANHEHLQATAIIANAVPCLADHLANRDGVPLGKTLSGEMVHLNLWDRETENWNVLVVGSSGTGKSFTINQLLIKNLPMNPYVMIIDKSQSYKTLCRLAGGRYLNYDLESKHHLNIFDYPLDEVKALDGEIDPDHIASIIMYLGVVLANIKENRIEEAEELDKALLQEAVKQTYRNCIGEGRVPLLSDLKETLLKTADDKKVPSQFQYICRKQAEVLKLYTGKGMYANLTDRESTVKADNSFIVFDTSGISDNDKKAIGLAVFTISNYCLSKAKENKELNRLSQLAMDECWYLAQYPAGLAFLLRIAKTARHFRLQPIFATQEIGEFSGVKGVEAILKNTSTKILLKLVGDDIDHAKGLLQLNPTQVEKIMNLHMVKGVYSQAMIHQTLRQGIVNIYPDELAYHIATTYGPEAAIRDRYLENYASDESPISTLGAIAKWMEDKENNMVLKPVSKEKEVISKKVEEVSMK